VWKKIWHDPVWSKVIATAIVAVLGWLTYRLNWWPGWMTQRLARLWTYLLSPSIVPHWILFLLILVAAPSFIIVGVLIWTSLFPKTVRQNETPDWTSYRTDSFDGLRWRWRYLEKGRIDSLYSFCPVCDYQVFPDSTSRFADRIGFQCESCGKNLGTHQGSYAHLESKVTRLIQQKLRTESWPGRLHS
jgi:hypothetical protein